MSLETVDKEYLGQKLLEKGFETWFRYMFRVVEGRPFIVEPIHKKLFKAFKCIYKQKIIRCTINEPPRSAKTTLAKWFVIYCRTINAKCNFIYTSYSQELLSDIAREMANILEHPVYKAMYPYNLSQDEDLVEDPIDEFWGKYLQDTTGKAKYTSKKIITQAGGVILLSAIGATITGFGAGIRGAEGFTGALIIDDANKPADVRSELMRNKVLRYYEETLLNRLNNSNVAIINIQQRLHKEDLSGLLQKIYGFYTLKIPLLINGVCQIPSQYTPERIRELQKNNFTFQAQFQQEPIILGGSVIETAWFKYYISTHDHKYTRIFMTGDTAQKVKQANDYSVFCVWGVTPLGKLHLIDMVRGKWEAPELKRQAIELWNRYKTEIGGCVCDAFYIEDKASGTALIQELKAIMPVIGLQRNTDKLTRVSGVTSYIEAGQVELPNNPEQNKDFLDECEAFTRDDSHKHDDIVDNLVDGITIGLSKLQVSILDVL